MEEMQVSAEAEPIQCRILGAGQDVGKSCAVVTLGSKTVMFDCGMHMGFQDWRRFPNFASITPSGGDLTQAIDCVIVTHFHLDHCGALPHFTEVLGYRGPIFMTYPTKALVPLMLEDYRKVTTDKRGEQELFTLPQIHAAISKVTAVDVRQTVQVGDGIEITAYYGGHVIGAAMFHVRTPGGSVLYTGDYNMSPDRHLGAANVPRLQPDLLITESTYATTIRDSKRARERVFLQDVHDCVAGGGKVLIPIFALGRAQELCILLNEYWERFGLSVPIYFSAGLTAQANVYYKMLLSWTNQTVQDSHVSKNVFNFPHVVPLDRAQMDAPGPCVLFATPGMLTGGLSLEVFKKWAPSERNLVVLPGFCVSGTVGHKLMMGRHVVELDKRAHLEIKCKVRQLSFSAHADAKGIMDLIRQVAPRHVVLMHGEKNKMAILKKRVVELLGLPCHDPPNNSVLSFGTGESSTAAIPEDVLRRQVEAQGRLEVAPAEPVTMED